MNQPAITLEDRPPNCEIDLKRNLLVCDPFGCLYWPDERILIVSDLHLEKGSSYAARREFMPPFDTGQTLNLLKTRIDYWKPQTVISLGDSFHDVGAAHRIPGQYRDLLSDMMCGLDWVWIRGNHDPQAPHGLDGMDAAEIQIGNICLRHEPLPSIFNGSDTEIAGHLHPAGKIRRRGKSIYRRCYVGDGSRLIMPSFGSFTGGLNIRNEAFDGLFDTNNLTAWLIGNNRVFEIDGRQLV